jgi:hypothetical protein
MVDSVSALASETVAGSHDRDMPLDLLHSLLYLAKANDLCM